MTEQTNNGVITGKVVTLPSGKTAMINEGTGRDFMKAMEQADGNQSRVTVILMSALVTVDGEKLPPEGLESLPLRDFTMLMAEFSAANF